jgi:hypothetical protein
MPVIVVAAFALVILLSLRGALVVDGWLDLVSGREIVQHGLPSHDALTVMAHGRSWVDQQWLAQLVLYELVRVGGVKLALFVHAALVIGALVAAAGLSRRLGASARSTTWICLPVLIAFKPDAAVMRSQSFSYLLFVVVLWLVLTDARSPSRAVFLVFPVLILWANLHGSALLGAGIVSLAGAVRIVGELRERPPRVSLRSVVLALGSWPCLLASPYALRLPGYYEKVLLGGHFGQFVSEWRPVTLAVSTVPVFLLVFGGAWLFGRAGARVSGFEALLFLAVSVLAFQAVRNAAWLALTALVVLPRLLDARRPGSVEPKRLNLLLATATTGAVALTAVVLATRPESWFTTGFRDRAAQAVSAGAGAHGDVFSDEAYADWLLWREPELRGRVAYDARLELLSSAQLAAIARFKGLSGNWMRILRGYDVVVLPRQGGNPIREALVRSKGFRVRYHNADVVVLERVSRATA